MEKKFSHILRLVGTILGLTGLVSLIVLAFGLVLSMEHVGTI